MVAKGTRPGALSLSSRGNRQEDANSKLRVIITGPLPPPVGGISTFCKDLLASSLVERAEVCFVQTSPQGRPLSETSLTRPRTGNVMAALRITAVFLQRAFSFRPQVTHISTAAGLSFLKNSLFVLIARLSGSKVLLHMHGGLGYFYTNQPAWQRWYVRQIVKTCNGLIVVSREWLAFQEIVPDAAIFWMPNAIDLRPYRKIAETRLSLAQPSSLGLQRPALRVLYLGYIGQAKGSLDLIEAARIILQTTGDVVFELVGPELYEGAAREASELIQRYQMAGRVLINASVEGAEKEAKYASADVFVCPSHYEGMPVTIIEAMAAGLPVVGTRVGGIPDLVEHDINGLLVECGRPELLAGTLSRLFGDRALRIRMGEQGYRRACQDHDMEGYVDRLLQLYNQEIPQFSP